VEASVHARFDEVGVDGMAAAEPALAAVTT
jgi:hypothetical protein